MDFLIDGQVAFVEQHSPYTYGRDGNYLVTSFLSPGQHSFTVRVITHVGEKAESTVKASVTAPAEPPAALSESAWSRQVTDKDVKQATSHQPPPPGQWDLTIDSVGWMVHDPQGGGLLFDVDYTSYGKVDLRPSIEKPPFPSNTGGAFCDEPDQSVLWTYTIGDGGKTLSLTPTSSDPCGDRLAILKGTWTVSGQASQASPAAPTAASIDTDQPNDMTRARLRLATFIYGGPNVYLYVNGQVAENGGQAQVDIPAGYVNGYLYLAPGTYQVAVVPSGKELSQALIGPMDMMLAASHRYTLAILGQMQDKSLKPVLIDETVQIQNVRTSPTQNLIIMVNNLTGTTP